VPVRFDNNRYSVSASAVKAFVKVNGKLCYLWRAVDHEGEVLEAVVTAKRDKAAALKFFKRIMKKYGRPLSVVTDGLCSYPAAMTEIGNPIAGRPVVGSTIAPRIRISRFDDENGPQAFVRQLREGPSGSIALSARG